MNKLDTGLVAAALKENGFIEVDTEDQADLVLMNSCSVRENAERRVLSRLGYMKYLKKTRPELIVGVIGCMAQRLGDELMKQAEVDIVCGPSQIPHLPKMVEKALAKHGKQMLISSNVRQIPDEDISKTLDDFEYTYDTDQQESTGHAFVRIMRGCNNFCTYCIVPYVRGPEISRPPQAIIEQCKKLASKGIKQITLLGQTVNSYEYTQGEKTYTLADILEMISEIEEIHWIKFVTSYPDNFSDRVFELMANNPKICPYLHMPAQSGSNAVLKAMNRKYTVQQYMEIIDRARKIVPEIAIAGDFIVGFPGETDEDFQQTLELVKRVEYKNIFAFKYSPRPGTYTDKKLEDNVKELVKKQRNIEILKVQGEVQKSYNDRFIDKKMEVFVEKVSKKAHLNNDQDHENPQLLARTSTDYIVVFNGPESLIGEFVKVKITKTMPLTLFGKLL